MDIQSVFEAIRSTAFATWVAESEWGFPFVESVHVLAVVLVVGSIIFVDLRLIGLVGRTTRVTEITRDTLPWTWGAFILALLSGSAMFASQPDLYWGNTAFRLKLCCLLLAGINMLIFERITIRSVAGWDIGVPAPPAARTAGYLSLLFWAMVVAFGRWIGFTL